MTVCWELLGPVLGGVLVVALVRKRGFSREAAWLVGALILFVLIPKKYPRLLLELLPYIALLISKELKTWSSVQQQVK